MQFVIIKVHTSLEESCRTGSVVRCRPGADASCSPVPVSFEWYPLFVCVCICVHMWVGVV